MFSQVGGARLVTLAEGRGGRARRRVTTGWGWLYGAARSWLDIGFAEYRGCLCVGGATAK